MRIILKPLGALTLLFALASLSFTVYRLSRVKVASINTASAVNQRPVSRVPSPTNRSLIMDESMAQGDADSTKWQTWKGKGEVALSRNTEETFHAKATVHLKTKTTDTYTALHSAIKPESYGKAVRVTGAIKIVGELREVLVAVQSFDATGKQNGWSNIQRTPRAGKWTQFDATLTVPAESVRSSVTITVAGKGDIYVEGVTVVLVR